mmetsp:Transcript_63429/g.136438  ORF Transcript_63429/g.136438 Transcript_63429/m.136438 type:complete len:216 (-) Transcript_63429:96-743(-)
MATAPLDMAACTPDSSEQKSSRGRRLSWADQIMAEGMLVSSSIPAAGSREAAGLGDSGALESVPEADPPGRCTVQLGILGLGNTYGAVVPLPRQTIAVEVITPAPDGLLVQAKIGGEVEPSLWLETEARSEGRSCQSFILNLVGVEPPVLEVIVEAHVMPPFEGRPSSTLHENVHLLRTAPPEVVAASNEGTNWRKASSNFDPEELEQLQESLDG